MGGVSRLRVGARASVGERRRARWVPAGDSREPPFSYSSGRPVHLPSHEDGHVSIFDVQLSSHLRTLGVTPERKSHHVARSCFDSRIHRGYYWGRQRGPRNSAKDVPPLPTDG